MSRAAARSTRHAHASLWRGTDYGWWLGADTASALAAGIGDFAIPLAALSITHSPALASLTETMLIGVQTLLFLPGGVLTDRANRKTLVIIYGLSGVALFGVASLCGRLHLLTWPVIVLLCIALGIRSGLLGNASNAMLRSIVPSDRLPFAMSLNSARDATVTLVGGPISSLLMTLHRFLPFLAGTVLNLAGTLCALPIHRYWHRDASQRQNEQSPASDDAPRLRDALGGLLWMLRDRFQRRLLVSAALAAGAGNTFLLVTTMHTAAGGTRLLTAGLVNAVAAAGMLLGSLLATLLIERVPSGLLIGATFAGLGIGFVGAALAPHPLVKAVFVFLALTTLPSGSAVIGGMQAMLVSQGRLGRVQAAAGLVEFGAYALLAAAAGWMLEAFSYAGTCLAMASLIAAGAIFALTSKALTTLPVPSDWNAHIARWNLGTF